MRKLGYLLTIPLFVVGCDSGDGFDRTLLDKYRSAIPNKSQVTASSPQASSTRDVGDPAMYASMAASDDGIATGINGAVTGIINLMKAIVELEPTLYNAETKEFIWGPWQNDDDYGTVLAYIVELPEGEDFQYAYALLRGVDNNIATMTPVIWGAATPDPNDEDNGVGVTLWDFEANYAFAVANDPDYATKVFDRGRFVAVYGAGQDENEPNDRFTFVVSVFRNWVPKDNPGITPVDLDYLYGRYEDSSEDLTLDFLDFALNVDVHEDGVNTLPEDVSIRMAFINGGWGRAEANAVGGELLAGESVDVVECWDDALARQYIGFDFILTGGSSTYTEPPMGDESLCVIPDGQGGTFPLFASSLDTLGIPSLGDIDPELYAALEDVALNGMPQD